MSPSTKLDKQDEVRDAVDRLNSETLSADQFMQRISLLLNEKMLKYSWVGFYMLEAGVQPPVLVLGHFQGAMTPHTRIHLNQGICGAAASSLSPASLTPSGLAMRRVAISWISTMVSVVGGF